MKREILNKLQKFGQAQEKRTAEKAKEQKKIELGLKEEIAKYETKADSLSADADELHLGMMDVIGLVEKAIDSAVADLLSNESKQRDVVDQAKKLYAELKEYGLENTTAGKVLQEVEDQAWGDADDTANTIDKLGAINL